MSKDRRVGWLAEIKVGDEVVVRSRAYVGHTHRLVEVRRITPTGMMHLSNEMRVNHLGVVPRPRSSMSMTGGPRLVEKTDEALALVERTTKGVRLGKLFRDVEERFRGGRGADDMDLEGMEDLIKAFEGVKVLLPPHPWEASGDAGVL